MTQTFLLAARKRNQIGKQIKQLRRNGQVPGVIYGHGQDSLPLTLNAKELLSIWKGAGSSQLVDLSIDEGPAQKVLLHDLQVHPVASTIEHIDLYAVKMDEEIETSIPLRFTGESVAVRDLQGNLITEKDEFSVRCLPGNLVAEIDVSLESLVTFDDVIRVSDIRLPDTIEVLHEPDEIVALVTAPRSEAELEAELAVTDQATEQAELEKLEETETPAEGEGEGEQPEGKTDE